MITAYTANLPPSALPPLGSVVAVVGPESLLGALLVEIEQWSRTEGVRRPGRRLLRRRREMDRARDRDRSAVDVGQRNGGGVAAGRSAGKTGNTTDVVTVTDSLGNVAATSVRVGPGVAIAPAMPTTPPRGKLAFTATGKPASRNRASNSLRVAEVTIAQRSGGRRSRSAFSMV